MELNFERYARPTYEFVNAAKTEEDIEVRLDPNFSKKTHFPKGSYIIQKKNGEQKLLTAENFERDYIKIQDNG